MRSLLTPLLEKLLAVVTDEEPSRCILQGNETRLVF